MNIKLPKITFSIYYKNRTDKQYEDIKIIKGMYELLQPERPLKISDIRKKVLTEYRKIRLHQIPR